MNDKSVGLTAKFLGSGLLIGAALVGCGGGSGVDAVAAPGATVTTASISGDAIKGPMSKAKVSVYKTTAAGTQGDLLIETTSDDAGHYSVTVTGYSGMVIVVASVVPGQTKMYDEATGTQIEPPSSFAMRTAIAAEAGKTYSVQINPFTELATTQALAKTGGLTAANVDQSNKDIKETLGFDPTVAPEFDATTKVPKNAVAAALKALSEMANAGDAGCAAGDQSTKVKCVTDALMTKGLTDVDMKVALQTRLDVELEKAVLPAVKITQPSGTPVTTATVLEQVKAFFGMLRSNAKALDATDLSLQTELQAVSDDLQNVTVPVVGSSLDALQIALRGAKFWNDIVKTPGATFTATRNFSSFENNGYFVREVSEGGCGIYSDTNYTVLATSTANARYVACGTAAEQISAIDTNGVAVQCQTTGDWCSTSWSTRVRIHPNASDAGMFTVYSFTRKAKNVIKPDSSIGEDTAARVQYPSASPGNVSNMNIVWKSNGDASAVSLAGELSPGFRSNNDGLGYYNFSTSTYVYKPDTVTVLGDKHNVSLDAVVSQVGSLDQLAISGSIGLVKDGALNSTMALESGSYMQATSGNNNAEDGSQEMLLKLKTNTASSSLVGQIKMSKMKLDKSGTNYSPTLMTFTGAVQRGGKSFFDGTVTAEALNHADFDTTQQPSMTNPKNMRIGMTGKVTIPNRPVLNIGLNFAGVNRGFYGNNVNLTGQYSQGSLVINLEGSSQFTGNNLIMSSTEGVTMEVDSMATVYPLTFGTATDAVGLFDSRTNRITYSDSSYEQF